MEWKRLPRGGHPSRTASLPFSRFLLWDLLAHVQNQLTAQLPWAPTPQPEPGERVSTAGSGSLPLTTLAWGFEAGPGWDSPLGTQFC